MLLGQRQCFFGAQKKFGRNIFSFLINHTTVADLRRRTGRRKTTRPLRTDGDEFLLFQKRDHSFVPIVSTAVFAVFSQQTGTYKNHSSFPFRLWISSRSSPRKASSMLRSFFFWISSSKRRISYRVVFPSAGQGFSITGKDTFCA